MKSSRVSSLIVATAVLLASCSSQSSTPVTTSSTVAQGAPVRTTVPSKPGAATKAWKEYVKSFVTIDVSGISKSDCGTYAMLVTEGSLTFYDWNGVQWTDISSLLMGGRGQVPLKVYSHDFTNDGVVDFFVTYGDNKARGGATYGGFFAFPWSGNNMCEWGWVDIDNGRDITKVVESPEIDQRHGVVYASGYVSSRWQSYGKLSYLPSSSSFIFQKAFKD